MVRLFDVRQKEVINIADGCRLGYVCDIEVNIKTGKIEAIILPGPGRIFGLFGQEQEYRIKWCDITQIGEDLILVDVSIDDILIDC
ncbi:MAG: YlmC/YmxH family sporulation protein [Clostridiales bacterium]|jgi:YlmC/YmxH family sporulation protein|nr:YlmC/YmxH family sporulation protein [Clostridiales bacterium]